MGGKSSTQPERFSNGVCQVIMSECPTVLSLKVFIHQVTANIPQNATENVRLLKTYEI